MRTFISRAVAAFLAFTMLTSVPSIVEAGIFRNQADLDQSVIFAVDPIFDSVGLLVGTDANGDRFATGTAFLIEDGDQQAGSRWLATAGHTLFRASATPWERLQFYNRADVLGGDLNDFYDIDLAIAYPGYDGSETTGGRGDDIGLARLSTNLLNVDPINRLQGSDADLIGAEFVVAGYGLPGFFGNVGPFDGIRRAGRNTIDSFGAAFGVSTIQDQFMVSDFDRFNSDNPLPLEWQATGNDSGSPWLTEVNGEHFLVGITNGGLFGDSHSFAIRTSLYNDWIDETIRVNSVPEPSSVGFLILSLIGIAARRKRCQIPTVTN